MPPAARARNRWPQSSRREYRRVEHPVPRVAALSPLSPFAGVAVPPADSAANARQQSSTPRARIPAVSSGGASGAHPSRSIAPKLGLKATTPHHAPGTRTDPAESAASASGTTPAATAAAAPPEDPPGLRPGRSGFSHRGYPGAWPLIVHASWSIAVVPMTIAPAARSVATAAASRSLTTARERPRCCGSPRTAKASFTATGAPQRGPGAPPSRRSRVKRRRIGKGPIGCELPERAAGGGSSGQGCRRDLSRVGVTAPNLRGQRRKHLSAHGRAATMPKARAVPDVVPTDRSSERASATSPLPHSDARKRAACGTTWPAAAHDSSAADNDVVATRARSRISGTAPSAAASPRSAHAARPPATTSSPAGVSPGPSPSNAQAGRGSAANRPAIAARARSISTPSSAADSCRSSPSAPVTRSASGSDEPVGARLEPARRHPHIIADTQHALAHLDGRIAHERGQRSADDHGERKPDRGRGQKRDHVRTVRRHRSAGRWPQGRRRGPDQRAARPLRSGAKEVLAAAPRRALDVTGGKRT